MTVLRKGMERIYKALHVQTTAPIFLFTAALGEQT